MNYAAIKYYDISNGLGVRTSVFVSGCRHHCKGCFNEIAWDFGYGETFTDSVIEKILDSVENDRISGISILGGEPLDSRNQGDVAKLINRFRDRFGRRKTIWLYTGYVFEDVRINKDIFYGVDVIVDGPFVEELKDITLKFRGSSNQRIIDMNRTIEDGNVILVNGLM